MLLPISGFFAAIHALLLVALSIRIILLRWREKVGIGSGDSKELAVAIRVQGNFIEFVPLALLLLALMELAGASPYYLYVLGGLLFCARISHAIGLTRTIATSFYRAFGVLGTFIILLVEAVYLILNYVQTL